MLDESAGNVVEAKDGDLRSGGARPAVGHRDSGGGVRGLQLYLEAWYGSSAGIEDGGIENARCGHAGEP